MERTDFKRHDIFIELVTCCNKYSFEFLFYWVQFFWSFYILNFYIAGFFLHRESFGALLKKVLATPKENLPMQKMRNDLD